MKRILLLIASFYLTCPLVAQTVQWAVRPTSAQLEGYGNLYKVKKNGKCGLIDRHNKTIVPADYDSISSFHDGFALAMNRRGNQFKIEAVIYDGDYDLQPLSEEVYATRYDWFSEGKMPVKGIGGWGYLGTDGNMVIPCQFQQAYPFSEGLASVKIDDKAYYINRNMDYLPIEAGYGDLVFGSTFSGNEAVVYSANMKGYVINKKGRTIRPYKVKVDQLKTNKYDHSVGDKAQMFEKQVQQMDQDNSYEVYKERNLYGYKKSGHIVLPAQLEAASPVHGDYANVRYKGQNGIIHFVDGTFNLQIDNNTIAVINKETTEKGSFRLNIPPTLEDASIRLKMIDNHGKELIVQPNSSLGTLRSFSFQPIETPQDSENLNCSLEVWNDNLLLWKKPCEIKYTVAAPTNDISVVDSVAESTKPTMRIASLSVSPPRANSKRASPKNEFFVTVSVSNSGDARGNANVALIVDGGQAGNKTVSVRGHGSANAIFAITGVKKERFAKVKAILKNNGRMSQEASIHFMPFY